jgi:hypothetical protein
MSSAVGLIDGGESPIDKAKPIRYSPADGISIKTNPSLRAAAARRSSSASRSPVMRVAVLRR